jgi:hypothetical protein
MAVDGSRTPNISLPFCVTEIETLALETADALSFTVTVTVYVPVDE